MIRRNLPPLIGFLRILLLLVCGASYPVCGQSSSSEVTFQLPLARAGHSFSLRQYYDGQFVSRPMTAVGIMNTNLDANGNVVSTSHSYFAASGTVDLFYDYCLYDEFTGESTPLNVYYSDLFYRHSFISTPWFTGTQASSYFFLSLDESRHGHVLSLNGDDVSYSLSTGPVVGYVATNSQGYAEIRSYGLFDAWSASSPSGDYFVFDHTTNEQTQIFPEWQRNLGLAQWSPANASGSTRLVTIWLSDDQSSYSFAVHTSSGYVQSLYPSWEAWPDGSYGLMVSCLLGTQQNFWLVREYDGADSAANGYTGYVDNDDLNLDWRYAFGSLPQEPNWQTVSFQVGQDFFSESIWVQHADGMSGSVWVDTDSGWYEPSIGYHVHGYHSTWDDNGHEVLFYYANFLASVDANQEYVILDSQGRTSFMDGFVPWHPAPPAGFLAIDLGSNRWGHTLKLKQSDGTVWNLQVQPGWEWSAMWTTVSGFIFPNTGDEEWVERSLEYLPYIAPFDPSQGFTIIDQTQGDEITFPASTSHVNLTEWHPAQPVLLKICATRLGHNLELHTAHGESFPLQNGAMQGFWSQDGNGRSWWHSYWIFEANSSFRLGVGWWVYDVDNDERSPLNQNDLSAWASGDATLDADDDGLPDWYEVLIGTSSSTDNLDGRGRVEGWDTDGDDLPDGWEVQHPPLDPRNPNDAVGVDLDGDGLPDWWEFRYGYDPNQISDGTADTDGDGLTTAEEAALATDPKKKDNPSAQLTVFGFTAP